MGDVIDLNVYTLLDIDPDKVLEAAKGELSQVFVFGYDHEDQIYVAGSTSDMKEFLWALERARARLMEMAD